MSAKRKPTILHVITPSRMAGAETFLTRLLRRAGNRDATHHCISSHSRANDDMRAASLEFDVVGIGGKANPLALRRLREAANECSADLLHSHLSTASWWCGWLEQVGGPPSIGHVHGFTSALWHRRQSRLIACSNAVKQDLIEKGVAAEVVTVMHYPIDPDDQMSRRSRREVREEFAAQADTPVVGTFAHLSEKKGYRELVQAAELVLRQIPRAQFWIFGEGVLRNDLEQTAKSLGIADRFRLFGFRRDVPDLMRAIDVMCLPSHREPFGLVYVEAALAEKPVIACAAGGAPEIIQHGDTGLLVPPPRLPGTATASAGSTVPILADAILSLLDNPIRAAAMGRCGRQLVLDRFAWPEYLGSLKLLYQQMMDEQPRAAEPARHAA